MGRGGCQLTWIDCWEDEFDSEAAALAELVYKMRPAWPRAEPWRRAP